MGLAATVFGVIIGTFAGLGTYTWRYGAENCGASLKASLDPFGVTSACRQASQQPWVITGMVIFVVLSHLLMWRLLKTD